MENYLHPCLPLHIAVVLPIFAYVLVGVLYRIYFSPLSKFPGPKIAAATFWYEFYYDAILKGRYIFKIKELHKEYGPIVRVSPFELHVDDPAFYHELYSYSRPRNKYNYYLKPFSFPLSAFGTTDSRLHRLRRAAMNPFFSKRKVLDQESLIQQLVKKLCNRVEKLGSSGQIIPLSLGYVALTTDLITSFVMDRDYGYLDAPDWHPGWGQTLRDASELSVVTRQLTWILPIMKIFPKSWINSLSPGLNLFYTLAQRCHDTIEEVREVRSKPYNYDGKPMDRKRTLFDQIFESKLDDSEKGAERMVQEIRSAIGAGTETTSNALTVMTYHLISNPSSLKRLQNELRELEPNPDAELGLVKLEQLPYLSSVILEGLRLSYGVSTRLQRISPDCTIWYKEYEIPPGTPVSMSSVLMHHNEKIFPDSNKFIPERWLDPDEKKYLERHMVSFSSGSRKCIGMNLAKAELFIVAGTIFRRFEFELCNTTRDDIDIRHELFVPRPKNLKTIGVQATLLNKLTH